MGQESDNEVIFSIGGLILISLMFPITLYYMRSQMDSTSQMDTIFKKYISKANSAKFQVSRSSLI